MLTQTDPNRAGEMGYRYAKGLQDKGVCAQVKHFVSDVSQTKKAARELTFPVRPHLHHPSKASTPPLFMEESENCEASTFPP